jgi:predicted aspartyl protease
VYWSAPAVAIVPFTLDRGGHIIFRMTLEGKRLDALLDTGASATNLNLDIAKRTFNVDVNAPDVEKIGELAGGYTASVYRRKFKSLAFEGVTINEPLINLLPNMLGPGQAPNTGSLIRESRGLPNLILGMSVLGKLHVYIAYKERKLYISAANP